MEKIILSCLLENHMGFKTINILPVIPMILILIWHIGWKLLYLGSNLKTLYNSQYLALKSGTFYSKLTFLVSNKDFIAGLCEKWTNIAWTGYVYKTGRGCQLDITGLQLFSNWPQFWKFDVPTGKNRWASYYRFLPKLTKLKYPIIKLTPPNVRVENNFVCKTKLAKCVKHSFCLAQAQVSS